MTGRAAAERRLAEKKRREKQKLTQAKKKPAPSLSARTPTKRKQNTRSQAKRKSDASSKTKKEQLKANPQPKLGTRAADAVQGALGSAASYVGERLPQPVKELGKKYYQGLVNQAERDYAASEKAKAEGGILGYVYDSQDKAYDKEQKFRQSLSNALGVDQRITDIGLDVAADAGQGRIGAKSVKRAAQGAAKGAVKQQRERNRLFGLKVKDLKVRSKYQPKQRKL